MKVYNSDGELKIADENAVAAVDAHIADVTSVHDHGSLGGLADDDHTQYRLESENHSHESSGAQGGTIDEDALATTDVTTGNATTAKHGFLKKLSNVVTQFMDGTGNYSVPDHGSLGGLSDDDHTAYATNTEFDDHNARHESGGADAMKLDDLAAPDDNTDLNASTTKHGLLKKLDNVATNFLDGTGAWSVPGGVHPNLATHDALGLATDAELATHAAGTRGNQFWIPAGAFLSPETTYVVPASVGTAPNEIPGGAAMSATATTGLEFVILVPGDWNSGTLDYQIYWIPTGTDAVAHTVRWSMNVLELVVGTTLVSAAGTTTAFTGTSAARTSSVLYTEPVQNLITPSAAGVVVRCNLERLGANGADTMTAAIRVIGINITYLADAHG